MVAPPAQPASWPLRIGAVPPLADGHSRRPETGLGLVGSLDRGNTVVLTSASPGVGTTQLAAALAHGLWDAQAVELLVWVNATSRDAVLAAYARAIAEVGAVRLGDDMRAAAGRFLAWLAETSRPWLVVIDALAVPADLDGLWPWGPAGRVLVTSQAADGDLQAEGRRVITIGAASLRESLAYVTARLGDPGQRAEGLDLATDLGGHMLALAQATAVMTCTGANCRDYRTWFTERRNRLAAAADADLAASEVTWSLCAELANQIPPVGLARPALVLASMLDPAGIPGAVFTSPAARAYLMGQDGWPAEPAEARDAVHNLARAGLVTINPASVSRTVLVHAHVQELTRSAMADADLRRAARVAADALLQAWPGPDVPAAPPLVDALRDNTASVYACAREELWLPECHPVLMRAGESMNRVALSAPAIAYWQMMVAASTRALGRGHAQTFRCRDSLAASYQAAGRVEDALIVLERTLTDRERELGMDHPDTLTSCHNLAVAYAAAGRQELAVPLQERLAARHEWSLGATHPETLAARADLAAAYLSAGMHDRALPLYEKTVDDLQRAHGPGHPDTLDARTGLAKAYHAAGHMKRALPVYERVVSDREKLHGPDHRDTIAARADLAFAYRSVGRMKQAVPQYERAVADRNRILGAHHPDTLTARANLANAYLSARRVKDAIPQYVRTVADREAAQGPDHPDTITARGNLANAYHSAGRLQDALPLYEQTLADFERVLGPADPATLTSRANLGSAYHAAMRLTEAITVFERTLSESERALGADHPLTRAVRENLVAVTRD
ncbi:MAG TPA: FxSxx-COOH system tetratricopeptide repeat protein [Streptosporangiaceae bacterium]|nr:FxSxx-COOH system tetratricopeptide repeat protein [Streptosporangiaceae bacterium]